MLNFCILTLYHKTLLKSPIISSYFLRATLGDFTCIIMSSANKDDFSFCQFQLFFSSVFLHKLEDPG